MTNLDKEIEEILKLDAERTQGEWELGSWLDNIFAVVGDLWEPICRIKRDDKNIHESQDKFDAAFIAAAPRMVSIIRQLQAENKRLKSELEDTPALFTNLEQQIANGERR